jgi:hypothetical protein
MRAHRILRWLREVLPGQIRTQIEDRRDGDEQPTDLLYHSRVDRPPPNRAPHLSRFKRVVDQDRACLRDRLPERHVGAPIYMDHRAQDKADATFSWVYKSCLDIQDLRITSGLPADYSRDCLNEAEVMSDSEPRYNLGPAGRTNFAWVSLLPLLLGWIMAYALVAIVRWGLAGF